jgi:hypothetical protein
MICRVIHDKNLGADFNPPPVDNTISLVSKFSGEIFDSLINDVEQFLNILLGDA